MTLTRRQFLHGTAAGTMATLAGCRPSVTYSEPVILRVFVYAGGHETTMREVFVPRFEALTGCTVALLAGWWDGMAKLRSAPANDPPFDLMITDATQGYPAAREGLFTSIDWTQIPNHRRLAPAALDHWIFHQQHGLLYPDSVMTLAYDTRQLPEPPVSWKDLLQPKLSGKLGMYNHFYMSLYTFACMLADSNGRAGTARKLLAESLDEVFRFARDQRPRIKLWWSNTTEMILALGQGSVAAGNMHSPEYWQAMREKATLGACVPMEDRAMVQVFWAIPAGSKVSDLAMVALDLLFSPEVQLEFTRRGMATARLDTAETMAKEDPRWKALYPHTEEQFRTLRYYPYDLYEPQWDQLVDRWERTVLRAG